MFNIFVHFKSLDGDDAIVASVAILHSLVSEYSVLLFVLVLYWGEISLGFNLRGFCTARLI